MGKWYEQALSKDEMANRRMTKSSESQSSWRTPNQNPTSLLLIPIRIAIVQKAITYDTCGQGCEDTLLYCWCKSKLVQWFTEDKMKIPQKFKNWSDIIQPIHSWEYTRRKLVFGGVSYTPAFVTAEFTKV